VSDDGCRPSHSVRCPRSQSSYQSSYFTVFHMLPSSKPSQSIVKHIGSEPISHPLSSRPRENIHSVTAARPVEVVLHGGGAASESVAGLSLLGSAVAAITSSSTQTHSHTHIHAAIHDTLGVGLGAVWGPQSPTPPHPRHPATPPHAHAAHTHTHTQTHSHTHIHAAIHDTLGVGVGAVWGPQSFDRHYLHLPKECKHAGGARGPAGRATVTIFTWPAPLSPPPPAPAQHILKYPCLTAWNRPVGQSFGPKERRRSASSTAIGSLMLTYPARAPHLSSTRRPATYPQTYVSRYSESASRSAQGTQAGREGRATATAAVAA
jgi:hypothetical protein